MKAIQFIERDMTDAEFSRMKAGFEVHDIEHGNPIEASERYGFVVMAGENFVGCASGLTDLNRKWFYLSDLFIEKAYRGQGLGAEILTRLEQKVASLGLRHIWTWTVYEAPEFYKKQGYEVFCEMEDWFISGQSRIGVRKKLEQK